MREGKNYCSCKNNGIFGIFKQNFYVNVFPASGTDAISFDYKRL